MFRHFTGFLAAGLCGFSALLSDREASACGCTAAPSPATPVVQAGERIAFAYEDGIVTAHIQIQYSGEASEFGWLLPLPAVPEFGVGTEELFQLLESGTQPGFLLNTQSTCTGGGGSFCSSEDNAALNSAGDGDGDGDGDSVLVKAGSAGPYEYAVLEADSKTPMLNWLSTNRFFVPAGTESVVDTYIHPGAYFLALRLRSGQSSGDIQPVVVRYASQYPMVPIILTQVAAVPDMGILVYVFGESRAIPRNYQHVLINEEYVDWANGAQNYNQVIRQAVDEAGDHHAFVTEFSGSVSSMVNQIDPPNRFGTRTTLETIQDPVAYLASLRSRGFRWDLILPFLKKTFPYPPAAARAAISEQDYYDRLDSTLFHYDPQAQFDPLALTAELWERVVLPVLEAGKLFRDHQKVTRMFTTLSPEEMTADPVFAWNPDLPDVERIHQATLLTFCNTVSSRLELSDGRRYSADLNGRPLGRGSVQVTPMAKRIEILREEGLPEVVVDNSALLAKASESAEADGGCNTTSPPRGVGLDMFLLLLLFYAQRRLLLRA